MDSLPTPCPATARTALRREIEHAGRSSVSRSSSGTFTAPQKDERLELGAIGARGANLLEIRGRQVKRLALYFDRDRALADLGLAPGADSAQS
jgi:hypothetical protein